MCLDRLNFLTKFDKFYQELISLAREDKINEPEFYMIITSKAKAMDRRRLVIKITEKGKIAMAIGTKPSLLNENFTQKFNQLEDWEQTLILSSIQRIASMMEAEKLAKKDIQKKLEKFKVDKI